MTSSTEQPPRLQSSSRLSSITPACVLVIAIWATLWPVLKCEFVYRDDDATLFANPYMNPPSIKGVIRYWTWPAMSLYVPVTYTVWSGLAMFSPPPALPNDPFVLDPMPFHAASLLVHSISAIFAWLILRRLFKSGWPALLGAMVFALHPLQVETVAWASGLKDVLAGCFSLIAVWEYFRFADAPVNSPQRRWRMILVLFWLMLGQLSKPSAVVVPLIIIPLDWLIAGRPIRQVLWNVLPIFACCVPVMIVAKLIQNEASLAPILYRPLIAMDAFSFYICKLFWPAGLAPDYARPPQVVLAMPWIKWCWVIPLLVIALALIARRRFPAITAGFIIFVAGILPVLGLITFQFESQSTVSDHYVYLSLFGISVIATATLSRVRSILASIVFGAVIVALAVRSYRQTWHWQDTITLFSRNQQVVPWSFRAPTQVGFILLKQNKPIEAEPRFLAALKNAQVGVTYMNLGSCLLLQGRTSEAIAPLEESVRLEPSNADARTALAQAYERVGRRSDAIAQLRQVLAKHPDDARARQLLLMIERR